MCESSRSRATVRATPGRCTFTTTCVLALGRSRARRGAPGRCSRWRAASRRSSRRAPSSGAPRLASTTSLISSNGTGGHVVLQLLQLGDELRRQDVGAGARDLAELDEARPEVLQHQARPLVDRDALASRPRPSRPPRRRSRARRTASTTFGFFLRASARSPRARRPRRSRAGRARWRSRASAPRSRTALRTDTIGG